MNEHDPAAPRRSEKPLTPAAQRALSEAAARRAAHDAPGETRADAPEEINGPRGLEPTRYGDWERKGIVSDF